MADANQAKRRNRQRTVLVIILIILFLLLLGLGYFIFQLVTPAGAPTADETPEGLEWVRSVYGYGPSAEEQLHRPVDAGFGPSGTIWVTDGQRARILGFTPDGEYTGVIQQGVEGMGEGQLYRPDAIDISEDGEIYIADFGREHIVVISEDNEFLREWPVESPREVAVQGDRVVVGAMAGYAIFDTQGELITLVGTRGSAPEQMDGVRGVVLGENGEIYIAELHNRRVKAYSADGELLWVSPPEDLEVNPHEDDTATVDASEWPDFQLPAGMTMDENGRLVLVDAFDFSIVVLDPENEGRLVAKYGRDGVEDGNFIYPTGIDYDSARDWFVIADTNNDRAQIVRIEGSGGGIPAALRRAWAEPLRICAIPLILLLIALVIAVTRSRANREQNNESSEGKNPEYDADNSGRVNSD